MNRLGPFTARPLHATASRLMTTTSSRKPGVSTPAELAAFVARAGSERVIVLDVRTNMFNLEPNDKASCLGSPLAESLVSNPDGTTFRPRALNVPFKRKTVTLEDTMIPASWIVEGGGRENVPIITHCGGGGRGQKAKLYLEGLGYKNVVNGGGPSDAECFEVYGHL